MLKFDRPTCEAVRKATNGRATRDTFMLGQSTDFANAFDALPRFSPYRQGSRGGWAGKRSGDELLTCAREGDLSAVAASDAFLEKVEAMFPAPTARRRIIDDVAGGFVNVPAMLAGVPTYMRRKAKAENEFAPLAIVADLTSSANITPDDVLKRGTAILALARALSARRPVELWAGCGLNRGNGGAWCFFQVQAAPLDLARAAFLLTDPGVSRSMAYGLLSENAHAGGHWPYMDDGVSRANFKAIVAGAFPHMADVLAIPSIHGRDKSITDPLTWLGQHVRTYGEAELADEALAA